MHGSPRLPCDQQWGRIWSSSGRTGSHQNSKGHKCGCLLWLPSGYKPSERWLWMQRWKDEEVPRASKEKDVWPSSQVCSNPKRREQASRPSCQCCITGVHDIPSKLLSFVQLSPLIDSVNMQEIGFKSNWTTPIVSYLKDGTLPNNKEAEGLGNTIHLGKKCLVQKRLLPTIPNMPKPRGSRLCYEGSSWKDLWEPLRVTITSAQTGSGRILLVYHAEGCPSIC